MDEGIENFDEEMQSGDEEEAEEEQVQEGVYLGEEMKDGEELTFDKSAYHMYHAAQTGTPCLSFDILNDTMGNNRTEYPQTSYMVAGTQAPSGKHNQLLVMKMSNLTKMDDDSESGDEYIEEEKSEDDPKLQTSSLKHVAGFNRIRATTIHERRIVSSWADSGAVHIWDITDELRGLDTPEQPQHHNVTGKPPSFTFKGHQAEGYAMDWSRVTPGRLATGSCNNRIHLWKPTESSWCVDQRPFTSHQASVEDIQWSPNEANVFASCSVDQTIKVWDARAVGNKACMLTTKAHQVDVNVISWNRKDSFFVSGGDDGILKVWDLRKFAEGTPVATFKHHMAPITSVEWHPHDSTVFAASSDDHKVTLWDLSVEKDDTCIDQTTTKLPPQLLFIHMGQTHIKEVHWHEQLPGVLISTASTGFNIFRTISV